MNRAEIMTENEVVEAVAAHLSDSGWKILSTRSTKQRGIDLLAERGGEKPSVEAKGAGSATEGTRRYGTHFTSNQKRSHVSAALLTAARVISEGTCAAGIALPDDEGHSHLIEQIAPALGRLGVRVFFVAPNRSVRAFGEARSKSRAPNDVVFGRMAGTAKIVGDVVSPIIPLEDWNTLK